MAPWHGGLVPNSIHPFLVEYPFFVLLKELSKMKYKTAAMFLFFLFFTLLCTGIALADGNDTLQAFVFKSDHLSISELTYTYESGTHGHGDVGTVWMDIAVVGPEDVRDVKVLAICSFTEYVSEWSNEMIARSGAEMAEWYKAESDSISFSVPPFIESSPVFVRSADLGTTMCVILIALDNNIDYAGYAVVLVAVPEDESAADMTVATGFCGGEDDGTNLTWSLSGANVLTVSGTGTMANYCNTDDSTFFRYWDSIRSIVFESGVTSVGANAFTYFTASSISLPDTLISIGANAFWGCRNLSAVTLPSGVEQIGEEAFLSCDDLTEVYLPDSIESIGRRAFMGCKNLVDLRLPNNAVTIGDEVFNSCEALKQIVIPSRMENIGKAMFSGCGLEHIQISDGVKTIGDYAFVDAKITSIAIPNSITSIGNYAFAGAKITSIAIPNSVVYIGSNAFRECENLTRVEVDCNGTVIGDHPFEYCNQLKAVYFTGTLAGAEGSWGFFENLVGGSHILEDIYYSGTDAQWLEFVLQWRNCAGFSEYMPLHHLVSGNTVESVIGMGFCGGEGDGRNVFWRLDQDKTLTLAGVGEMSPDMSWVFADMWTWQDGRYVLSSSSNKLPIAQIKIGEGITSIPEACFSNTSATSVSLPDSLTVVGDSAFASCKNLKNVTMGTNIETESIGMFFGSPIETIIFTCTANGRRTVPGHLFDPVYLNSGASLKNVHIPEGVMAIGEASFGSCSGLTTIYLPDSLTVIGDNAFKSCDGLTEIMIPEGVLEIGEYAFGFCSNLQTVSIPNSVQYIGKHCFRGCSQLRKVTMGLDTGRNLDSSDYSFCQEYDYRYDEQPFSGCPVDTLVLVSGRRTAYKGGTEVHFFDNDGDLMSGFVNSTLKTIVLSEGITQIDSCIIRCSNLKALYIPKSVESVDGYCLYRDCASSADVYYAGSRYSWAQMMNFGHYVDEPLFSATIHFGENYEAPGLSMYYSTMTGTASSDNDLKLITFDAGRDLYKNGKTNTSMKIAWDFSLFEDDARGYSKDLAIASVILSGNAYNKGLIEETLGNLGFQIIKQNRYENGEQNAELGEWYSDTVGYSIASTTEVINGTRTNVIAIICRGSAPPIIISKEWQSDILQMETGFSNAAADVLNGLDDFINNAANGIDTSLPVKFLLTGHSRGGAVANLVGAELSDQVGKKNVYVYTFASPTTTSASNRHEYTNIKNFINKRDAVPATPGWLELLKEGGIGEFTEALYDRIESFNRYGIECAFDKSDAKQFDSFLSDLTGGSVSSDVDTVIKEHSIGVYAAYVMSVSYFGAPNNYEAKIISVQCPVDVAVYDSKDRLLGMISDNEPDDCLIANSVFVVVDGDEKYIFTSSDVELCFEMIGTDVGEMTYTVDEIDFSGGNVTGRRSFSNVALSDGKTMTSTVAKDIAVPDTQLFLRTEGKVTAEIDNSGNETDVVVLSFDTDLGEPIRDMIVPMGNRVDELPTAKMSGYVFEGWYMDWKLTTPFDLNTELDRSMTLYASYTPLYDSYGFFTRVFYDGEALTATLEYEYNTCGSTLILALYHEGMMLAAQALEVASDRDSVSVTIPISGLCGIYSLRAFTLDNSGAFLPISESAEVSFYAD